MLNNTYIESTEGTTQGDPMAMAMYALAVTPLIKRLREVEPDVKQIRFADDATAAGKLLALQQWWQHLTVIGPEIGYHPNSLA